ncbi:unnamed protein product [Orchesella dallaii]|uniref:Uncharacterized protein n=1 Tax=Orchesella dallaii TaxID=48710 RepID=A0ABP1PXI7_9HEXA
MQNREKQRRREEDFVEIAYMAMRSALDPVLTGTEKVVEQKRSVLNLHSIYSSDHDAGLNNILSMEQQRQDPFIPVVVIGTCTCNTILACNHLIIDLNQAQQYRRHQQHHQQGEEETRKRNLCCYHASSLSPFQ